VRVLILDPARAILTSSRFVTMAGGSTPTSSSVNVKPEYRTHSEAFYDCRRASARLSCARRKLAGMSDTYEPRSARLYLNSFETLWNACEIEPELRQLQL